MNLYIYIAEFLYWNSDYLYARVYRKALLNIDWNNEEIYDNAYYI